MKIVILDKNVRRNLDLFRQLVHRHGQTKKVLMEHIKKGYKAYLNCKTGELRFIRQKGKDFPKDQWMAIILLLHPGREGAFEVLSADNKEAFDLSHLDKGAEKLFYETLKTLNELAYHPQHARDTFWILQQIASLDFILSDQEEGVRNLVHDAWYNVDRLEAEELLSGKQFGTYLFRKDEFAQDLEDTLNGNSSSPVTCITLTYTEKKGKICEKTLVYKEGKWLFYDDDPTLSEVGYDSVKELLSHQAKMLQQPLFARKAS